MDVRDEREDLVPIPAHLRSAAKASGWMCRSLVLVVLGKARCQGLEIMLVRRAHQPIDRRKRLLHAFPPRFHSSGLELMASMGRKSRAVKAAHTTRACAANRRAETTIESSKWLRGASCAGAMDPRRSRRSQRTPASLWTPFTNRSAARRGWSVP